jgi:hypothetical protein
MPAVPGSSATPEAGSINNVPETSTAEADPSDRRAFPRRDSECVVSIHRQQNPPENNEQQMDWQLHSSQLKGSLADISMNGVSFLLSEPIERGENIVLRMASHRFNNQVDTEATVLRSFSQGRGQWKVVCQFRRNLTFEEVHNLSRQLFESNLV